MKLLIGVRSRIQKQGARVGLGGFRQRDLLQALKCLNGLEVVKNAGSVVAVVAVVARLVGAADSRKVSGSELGL